MFPVLAEPFGFQISTFGLMVALAFFVGGNMAAKSFEKAGLRASDAWDVLVWCVVGGMLGAKTWYTIETLSLRPDLDFASVAFNRAGLVWYGGFVGGALAGLYKGWRLKLPLRRALDCAPPSLAIGHAIGRIGCFLVGDDWGVPSQLPWAVTFDHPKAAEPTFDPLTQQYYSVHPTMLYEMLWLLPVTWWLWRRRGVSPWLMAEWLVLTGLGRLWIEGLRRNPAVLGNLSSAQVMALLCIALGTALWFYARREKVN